MDGALNFAGFEKARDGFFNRLLPEPEQYHRTL